tara:strand:- start:760 stop:1305 length:546 start_codon:yes stop_codon:yes gene_type:complete
MKIDLFPIVLRKYSVPNNDAFITHWTKEYNECKFKEISPLIMGYGHMEDANLNVSYIDILNQFMIDIGANETHSYGMQSFIFKCLEKGESIDAGDFLPSHYTLVHYVSDCKKSDLFFHPAKQLARSYDPTGVSEWVWDTGFYVNAGDVIIYPSYLESASPKNELTDIRMTVTIPIVLRPNE